MTRFECPCYGVVLDGDKVLVLRKPSPHRWEFPGGLLEREESLKDAVRRQVFEDTNLKVEPGIVLPVRDTHNTVSIFGFCEYKGGNVVLSPRAHMGHAWVPLHHIHKTIQSIPVSRAVDAFIREIKK